MPRSRPILDGVRTSVNVKKKEKLNPYYADNFIISPLAYLHCCLLNLVVRK